MGPYRHRIAWSPSSNCKMNSSPRRLDLDGAIVRGVARGRTGADRRRCGGRRPRGARPPRRTAGELHRAGRGDARAAVRRDRGAYGAGRRGRCARASTRQYDARTGLRNRRAFDERIESELFRARRHGGQFALCLLDLEPASGAGRDSVAVDVLQGVASHLSLVRGEDAAYRLRATSSRSCWSKSRAMARNGHRAGVSRDRRRSSLPVGQRVLGSGDVPARRRCRVDARAR